MFVSFFEFNFMATLLDFFKADVLAFSLDKTHNIQITDSKTSVDVRQRIGINIDSAARFFNFYIPETDKAFQICTLLLSKLNSEMEDANQLGNTKCGLLRTELIIVLL